MILVIDNYDSFTYNIVQYLKQLNRQVIVLKNDEVSINDIEHMQTHLDLQAIILGPGPGTPDNAGITLDCIKYFGNRLPLLGICLGHQAIAQVFGASIIRAQLIMHGRTSLIHHNEKTLFLGLNNPTTVTRYHSLLVDKTTLPATLEVTAWTPLITSTPLLTNNLTDDKSNVRKLGEIATPHINKVVDEIMAIRHTHLPIEGVQFHPESILSDEGHAIFNNFLTIYC